MNAINPKTLADVLQGIPADGTEKLRGQIAKDPRLVALVWFLQALSRTPAIADLQRQVEKAGWLSRDHFEKLLRFLSGELPGSPLLSFEQALADQVQRLMDRQAAAALATLAETKVSRIIFQELDLALIHKVPVPIVGDSRFGKTKAVSVWCEMRPGRARLVTVPESNRDWDFFSAIATALGIEHTDRTPAPRLKREVEYVLRHSGLFIVFDEAHFLVPVNYHKDTPPKRINWVRCQVIDKGIGCAFFATPQSYRQTLQKYAETTKYNFEQWLGRLAPPIVLADYYDRDELLAVAKVHFPEFPDKSLQLICARAMQSEGYLKSMDHTARYANALAGQRGHHSPTLLDVEESIARMMPGKPMPDSLQTSSRNARRNSNVETVPAGCGVRPIQSQRPAFEIEQREPAIAET